MKKLLLGALTCAVITGIQAQVKVNIDRAEVERVERVLASDEMEGRRTFTPAIDRAAEFIAAEFKKAGLEPVDKDSYLQTFYLHRTGNLSGNVTVNDQPVNIENVVVMSLEKSLDITPQSGYQYAHISATDTFFTVYQRLLKEPKNLFITVDPAHGRMFNSLKRRNTFSEQKNNVVFALAGQPATSYKIQVKQDITELRLQNVVGILPGKSKKTEKVIFSAHYDHLGIGRPDAQGDSIYNGANDDAAGTTAVIMLAYHYAREKNNERTLIFAAFTAEEVGGMGSTYFSQQYNPEEIVAMFNIEMIGTDSKWGKNSAYITGYEKSSMGEILKKNLQGTGFSFHPDPYPDQNLFYRSDNATLARLGVPAHTISTSKMDIEPHYHKPSDEVDTLDLDNMTEIIKAIALSATSIVKGADTPTRVDTSQLR